MDGRPWRTRIIPQLKYCVAFFLLSTQQACLAISCLQKNLDPCSPRCIITKVAKPHKLVQGHERAGGSQTARQLSFFETRCCWCCKYEADDGKWWWWCLDHLRKRLSYSLHNKGKLETLPQQAPPSSMLCSTSTIGLKQGRNALEHRQQVKLIHSFLLVSRWVVMMTYLRN